jgi:uncharacterized protein (TIGR02391 family)
MPKKFEPSRIEPREFRTVEDIERGIGRLKRRLEELKKLDVADAFVNKTGADDVAMSNIRETIREVFGPSSAEFHEHGNISHWRLAGVSFDDHTTIRELEKGRAWVAGILNGLIGRLEEKRADLVGGITAAPSMNFDGPNLHPRILDVANDLFRDGHRWDAVFAASKALLNYVKERSNRHDLDGAPLVRAVFSRNDPILPFNDLADPTQLDEQEGMMHLFEGAVLAIRNPGGHAFPEGPEQRAIEYISFLSLLAYRVQEAKRRK